MTDCSLLEQEEFVNFQGLLVQSSKWFGISSVQLSSLETGLECSLSSLVQLDVQLSRTCWRRRVWRIVWDSLKQLPVNDVQVWTFLKSYPNISPMLAKKLSKMLVSEKALNFCHYSLHLENVLYMPDVLCHWCASRNAHCNVVHTKQIWLKMRGIC